MKRNIAVVFGSLILALLLGEAALRLFWTNPFSQTRLPRFVELKQLAHPLQQKFSRQWMTGRPDDVVLAVNERGYIEPAFRFKDPQLTIAFFGGSTTECLYVTESVRFPALVGSELANQQLKVNVLNAGVSGSTTHDMLNLYLNHVVQDRPQIVVLMEATNDRGVLLQDPSYSSRSGIHATALSAWRFLTQSFSQVSSLGGLLREFKYRVMVKENASEGYQARPEDRQNLVDVSLYRSKLTTFVAAVKSFGATPVLMTQPLSITRNAITPEWINMSDQERFNAVIREVAQAHNVALVDLEAQMRQNQQFRDQPELFLYDGMHATDLGSRTYAREILKILVPLIERFKAG